ncbi:hypothetical protein ACHQM5_005823 [Ranunculus cassubicifolius]
MSFKISNFSLLYLWICSLLLLLHGCSNNHRYLHTNRKLLTSTTTFDFVNFHRRHRVQEPDPTDYEIDPRYGVEKRLVPTGPNPLHH